ncbi:MAG: tripartite tricarboxylate transporter substrate binding protein [Rhizobiaceae bacterium]|nr:tripartite tricarboxylate transporter substrate binding protein [Rhizobiaceae bacterium]
MKAQIASFVMAAALVVGGAAQAQDFPSKPIEVSIWAAAGGGTDVTNRLLAEAMQKHLGTRINAVNRTGGGGGVAMTHVWNQDHDGHSWLGASEAMQVVKVMGYHDTGTPDWRWYMVGGWPGVISVPENSPYKSFQDMVDASKENPGSVRISHCPLGCVWHMKALASGQAADVEFTYVPYDGSAPAHIAAMSGEVDAVVSGVGEQAEFIRAGRLRPIAMTEMEPFDFPEIGEIEAVGADYPKVQDIPTRQWLGMAIPKDTPEETVAIIDEAFEAAIQDPSIQQLAQERLMVISGLYGDEAEAELQKMEDAMSWALFDLGIATTSPDELGIEKP